MPRLPSARSRSAPPRRRRPPWGGRPDPVEGTTDLLVVGSGSRTGADAEYGRAQGERPDTLAIAHLSTEREAVTVVSIPRDSVVDLPACDSVGGEPGQRAHTAVIGEALDNGGVPRTRSAAEAGPAC